MNEVGEQMALERALSELQDPEPEVRVLAIRRLRIIGGPQAVAAIMGALDDPDDKVWGRAALALRELEAREVVPALIEHLRNDPTDKT
jgi:HEAT repeat protein